MKTIGLIGGMSWESTVSYYQIINRKVKEGLGGLHSAKCVLCSVDFGEVEALQAQGDWGGIGEILAGAARALEKAGADFGLICINTMHEVFGRCRGRFPFPFYMSPKPLPRPCWRAG